MGAKNWYISGYSTAAAIVVEKAASTVAGSQQRLRLEGYAYTRGSTVASTVTAKLQVGNSSGAVLSSHPIATVTAPVSKSVHGMNVTAGFFAIHSGTTANDGTVAELWGSYA